MVVSKILVIVADFYITNIICKEFDIIEKCKLIIFILNHIIAKYIGMNRGNAYSTAIISE